MNPFGLLQPFSSYLNTSQYMEGFQNQQQQELNSFSSPSYLQACSISNLPCSSFSPNHMESFQFIDSILHNAQNTISSNFNLIQTFQPLLHSQTSDYQGLGLNTPQIESNPEQQVKETLFSRHHSQSLSSQSTHYQTNDSLDIGQEIHSQNAINIESSKRSTVTIVDLIETNMNPYPTVLTEEDLRIAEKRQIRLMKIAQYRNKRRNWKKSVAYDCRKAIADSRIRVKGRFVSKKETSTIQKMVGECAGEAFNSKKNLRLDFINSQVTSNGKVNSAVSKDHIIQFIERIIQTKETSSPSSSE